MIALLEGERGLLVLADDVPVLRFREGKMPALELELMVVTSDRVTVTVADDANHSRHMLELPLVSARVAARTVIEKICAPLN